MLLPPEDDFLLDFFDAFLDVLREAFLADFFAPLLLFLLAFLAAFFFATVHSSILSAACWRFYPRRLTAAPPLLGLPLPTGDTPAVLASLSRQAEGRLHDASSLVTFICHHETDESCIAKMLTHLPKMATSFPASRELLQTREAPRASNRRVDAARIRSRTKNSVHDIDMSPPQVVECRLQSFPQ